MIDCGMVGKMASWCELLMVYIFKRVLLWSHTCLLECINSGNGRYVALPVRGMVVVDLYRSGELHSLIFSL